MANVTDVAEFELSKENIQPIQQGRKADVLKSALSVQPEDKLMQQRRLFEQELRSYSGDDPLSVWCNYIKWVEQNYPKGGREGNICKLIQQCLLILKDEKQYHNDERFIDIWLKFANISMKPMEVYGNMFSRGIGCSSARFYIAWAWEAEQLGSIKRADEILVEGLRRNAQPIENLKSIHSELEMRITQSVATETEKIKFENIEEPEHRSAFTTLKTQGKNKAPISRVGDSTIATNRQNMTLNQHQTQSKNSQPKIPFKIYSGDNESSTLPAQNKKGSNYSVHSEGTKENEKKPSKWNKVKVQQTVVNTRDTPKVQEFTVHCDDTPQPNSVKKVPQTSQVLTARKHPLNPPIAIFEPPNPMVVPMYNKMKVYGGAEEFSFEEIRAVKFYEMQRKAEKERKRLQEEQEKEELKKQVKQLQEKIQVLEILTLPTRQQNKENSSESDTKPPSIAQEDELNKTSSPPNKLLKTSTPFPSPVPSSSSTTQNVSVHPNQSANDKKEDPTFLRQLSNDLLLAPEVNTSSISKSQRLGTTYMANEVDCMMRELYNGTLGINTALDGDLSFGANAEKSNYNPVFDNLGKNTVKTTIPSYTGVGKGKFNFDLPPLPNIEDEVNKKNAEQSEGFAFYYDPTELLPNKPPVVSHPIYQEDQAVKINDENVPSVPSSEKMQVCNNENIKENYMEIEKMCLKPHDHEKIEKILAEDCNQDEDIENVPPADYVQGTGDKRELAGILQPSKNIYFVPLEKQLEEANGEEGDDDDIDQGCLAGVRPLDDNLTMLTAEQFAAAACFMSTPCVKPQPMGIRESVKKSEQTAAQKAAMQPDYSSLVEGLSLIQILNQAFAIADSERVREILKQVGNEVTKKSYPIISEELNNKIQELLKLCCSVSKNEKLKFMVQHCISLHGTMVSGAKGLNQTNAALHCQTLQLSTIMETSRESKSSSSSGSCMSSMLKVKSMQSSTHLNSVSKLTKASTIEHPKKSSLLVLSEENTSCTESAKDESAIKNSEKAAGNTQHNIDPFDPVVTSKLLESLAVPVSQREDFYDCKNAVIHIKPGSFSKLGNIECLVESQYAEGAYAKVYSGQCIGNSFIDFNQTFVPAPRIAIKVCKNANEWEFYICSELHNRLLKGNYSPDITNCVMKVRLAVAFQNSLIIVNELFEQGTLLDVVNVYKAQKIRVPECLVMFFALEMLQILSGVHQCGIVHGDVKPDNFILNDIAVSDLNDSMLEQPQYLRLIDFGRSIDLTLFDPGTSFSVVVKTDAFQCVQMKEGRPWIYETDWYGVLGCIHILLFSEYMDVRKNANGLWEPTQKFKRYFQTDIWQPLFQALLNIPSCDQVPDLQPFITMLRQKLEKQIKDLKIQMCQMVLALGNRPRFGR